MLTTFESTEFRDRLSSASAGFVVKWSRRRSFGHTECISSFFVFFLWELNLSLTLYAGGLNQKRGAFLEAGLEILLSLSGVPRPLFPLLGFSVCQCDVFTTAPSP